MEHVLVAYVCNGPQRAPQRIVLPINLHFPLPHKVGKLISPCHGNPDLFLFFFVIPPRVIPFKGGRSSPPKFLKGRVFPKELNRHVSFLEQRGVLVAQVRRASQDNSWAIFPRRRSPEVLLSYNLERKQTLLPAALLSAVARLGSKNGHNSSDGDWAGWDRGLATLLAEECA